MADTFVYVEGDRNKTPVVAKDQPAGTALVMVTPDGRDYHFLAGKTVTNSPSKIKERFDKGNRGQIRED